MVFSEEINKRNRSVNLVYHNLVACQRQLLRVDQPQLATRSTPSKMGLFPLSLSPRYQNSLHDPSKNREWPRTFVPLADSLSQVSLAGSMNGNHELTSPYICLHPPVSIAISAAKKQKHSKDLGNSSPERHVFPQPHQSFEEALHFQQGEDGISAQEFILGPH